jgi:hypothetical protein
LHIAKGTCSPSLYEITGYALGVAARIDHRGGLVGYFFGGRYEEVPTADDVGRLRAGDSILVKRICDLGLIDKTWQVIMSMPKWRREDWPIPAFGQRASIDRPLLPS